MRTLPWPAIATTDDVLGLMDASLPAAALSSALALGLFWRLDARPLDTAGIARTLGIPQGRCRRWLELVRGIGLLEGGEDGWSPSPLARAAIVGAYSESTWAMLAQESRERLDLVRDLPRTLRDGIAPSLDVSYVDRMSADPCRARSFCRMLLELHEPLAARLASVLDLTGVRSVLDLGGGSGVVAIALAMRHPDVQFTIVDIATVCDAGREIIREHGLEDRIQYRAGDLVADELPSGFELAIECDVGVYEPALFARVRSALSATGRFVIVDEFEADAADVSHLARTLVRSLRDADFAPPTAAGVRSMLRDAGFGTVIETPMPAIPGIGGAVADRMVVMEARAGDGAG